MACWCEEGRGRCGEGCPVDILVGDRAKCMDLVKYMFAYYAYTGN